MLMSAMALATGAVPVAHANSIIVNSKLDTADPTHCRLRDAITAAYLNMVTGGCPARAPRPDGIHFAQHHPPRDTPQHDAHPPHHPARHETPAARLHPAAADPPAPQPINAPSFDRSDPGAIWVRTRPADCCSCP